jgi:cytoskeletal protein RodZ
VRIGETLAEQRREAGLTVTQVSSQTRIRETVIKGIERNDFSMCGGNFYARGHIRSISEVIGIDPEPLVREYDAAHGSPEALSAVTAFEPEIPVQIRERRAPNWTAAMAVALVFVLIYGLVRVFSGDGTGTRTARPPAAPATRPSPSPGAGDRALPATPRKQVELKVKARRASWLNVRDAGGKEIYSGIMRRGDVREWSTSKRIRILIGNGGGVKLTVNGRDIGAPGASGEVLRLSFGPGDPRQA